MQYRMFTTITDVSVGHNTDVSVGHMFTAITDVSVGHNSSLS